jgi:hypothetical protein
MGVHGLASRASEARTEALFEELLRSDRRAKLCADVARVTGASAPLVEDVFGDRTAPPSVLFICSDSQQRNHFLRGADHQLTGHHWHPSANPAEQQHHGRQHILFAVETDAHRGRLQAWRLPNFPPGHPARDNKVRRLNLVHRTPPVSEQTQLRV